MVMVMVAATVTEYEWKPGAHFSGDPNKAGQALEELRQKKGGWFTAEDVIQFAKSRKSPIHEYFTWDDTEAAKQYRLHEARKLTHSIVVYTEHAKEETIRGFVHLQRIDDGGEKAYTSIEAVKESAELQEQLLESAMRDLRIFRHKYAVIKQEFAGLFEEIDKII